MAAGNRSPLGFGTILAFHTCLLVSGIILQNLYEHQSLPVFIAGLTVLLGSLGVLCLVVPRFVFDIFRSLKSAAVLLTLLVLACILGTALIQELDLRRANVFDPGIAAEGEELPPFDDRNQSTRFALAESHAILWLFPNEERRRMLEEKVRLTPIEERQLELRREAFGDRAAKAHEEAILASKRRQVEQLTTSNYARDNHGFFYDFWNFCRSFHLFDIFESWWFYILLFLIAANNITGTIVRAPWRPRDWGIAITHAGVIIILAGSLLDLITAKEGYIYFTYGKPREQIAWSIQDQKNQELTHLPFRVHLERFATEYYHEMLVERYDWQRGPDGKPQPAGNGVHGRPFTVGKTLPVREKIPRLFEDGRITVTVHDYKPRVFVRTKVVDDPEGELRPAVRFGVYNRPSGGENLLLTANTEPWIFAFEPRRRALDVDNFRFEYEWAGDRAEYDRLLRTPPVPDNGWLVLKLGDAVIREKVALGQRRTIQVGERSLDIEFLKIESALAEQENVNLDRRLQRSEEPILYLRVDGQPLPVHRDDSAFSSGFHILNGLECRFEWPDDRDAGVVAIYRIVAGDGLPPVLVQADARTGAVKADPLREGATVPLSGLQGFFLGLEGSVRSAREERDVQEVTDEEFLAEGGGSRDHLLAAEADVEIEGPFGTVRRKITPYDAPIRYGRKGGPPLYAFGLVKTQQARDWFSVLSVIENDAEPDPRALREGRLVFRDEDKLKTHTVQVNSPLRYGGYRFFQATAATDRDGLGISGISVTSNPGVNFMYVGYTILTLGVCYIFFARPVIDRRRRRRRKEAA